MPATSLPTIFTTRTIRGGGSNFVTVPKRFVDSEERPNCVITVDLDGHSQHNVFVLLPWTEIRAMAEELLDACVVGLGWGGFETYGLKKTYDALINPTLYDPDEANNPVPAAVEQPDGDVDSVAIPSDTTTQGYGEDAFSYLPRMYHFVCCLKPAAPARLQALGREQRPHLLVMY